MNEGLMSARSSTITQLTFDEINASDGVEVDG